jgi:hypothetical protein
MEPTDRNFVPRDTPWWFGLVADYVVAVALVVVWGSAAFATFELLRGRPVVGALLFAVWLPLFTIIVRSLHHRGRVSNHISVVSTLLFIALVAMVCVGL